MKKILLLTVLTLCLCVTVRASHIMGAEITYKALDYRKYEVTLKIYRDCRGIPLGTPGNWAVQCASGGSLRLFAYSKVSIRDISPRCDTATTDICYPQNTQISNEGTEEHVYKGVIDFNTGLLATDVANGCCEFRIIYDECCRNGATNTGSAGNFYVFTTVNICKGPLNSSPEFTNVPPLRICCNMPFYYNPGAIDTTDGDSLAYELAPAKESGGTNFTYGGSYSYYRPITTYNTGNPNLINPNANPPVGFYLDPTKGDLIFTATGCSEVGPVVIVVKEYRKDSSGVYQKLSETARDMQFVIKNCSGSNNPPTITGSGGFNYNVCEGNQLCFNIYLKDLQVAVPAPGTQDDPDSLSFAWDGAIAGATMTVDSTTSVSGSSIPYLSQRNARFCWTPKAGDASVIPHTFTVTTTDKRCPFPAKSTRSFSVRVKKLATVSRQYQVNSCGQLKVTAIAQDSISHYSISIWDSLGPAGSDKVNKNTGQAMTDSFQFRKPGVYRIHVTVNNSPLNCSNLYIDTITINPSLQISIDSATTDTLIACHGSSVTLSSTIHTGKAPFRYKWLTDPPQNTADDSSNSYSIGLAKDMRVSLYITDSSGCTQSAVRFIRTKGKFNLGPDIKACSGDTIILLGPWNKSSYLWLPDSINTRNRPVSLPGEYVLQTIDTNNCMYSDTVTFDTFPLPPKRFYGKDSSYCDGDSIRIFAPAGYSSYLWSTGEMTDNIWVGKRGLIYVTYTDTNGCSSIDELNIKSDSIPPFYYTSSSITNKSFSFLPTIINPDYTYFWTFGDGDTSWNPKPEHSYIDHGTYKVCLYITNLNGCTDSSCNNVTTLGIKNQGPAFPVTVYPNPFAGSFDISIDIAGRSTVSYALYDLLGQQIIPAQEEIVLPGKYKKQIDLHSYGLADGVYFLQIRVNDKQAYVQLMKVN